MTNRSRVPQQPTPRPPTRRQVTYQTREANLQRRVALAIGGAVALALSLVIGGLVWQQFVRPNQTIKRVNEATLTRRDYNQLQRNQIITNQIVRGLQLLRFFGPGQNFGQEQSFDEQVLSANFQLASLGTARSSAQGQDDAQVEQWVEEQIVDQYGVQQLGNPQPGEIDQALVADLGTFLPTATVSGTDTLSGTNTLSGTDAVSGTSDPAATATATPPPTATPLPEQATTQANQIVDTVYTEYVNLINQFAANSSQLTRDQSTPHMTREELSTALRSTFRQQVLRERIGTQLLPEVPAEAEPEFIQLRQIVLQVPPPTEAVTGTDTLSDTGELSGTDTLSGTTGITDTSTLSPEQLEELFAERQTEANDLRAQLVANPDQFETLAQENSEDQATAAQGGTVGLINREGAVQEGTTPLPQAVIDAAWALPDNGISEPIRTPNGWVIVQRQPEDPEQKLQRLRQDALTTWINEKRASATIVPPPSPSPSPSLLEDEPTPFATETEGQSAPSESATTTP